MQAEQLVFGHFLKLLPFAGIDMLVRPCLNARGPSVRQLVRSIGEAGVLMSLLSMGLPRPSSFPQRNAAPYPPVRGFSLPAALPRPILL